MSEKGANIDLLFRNGLKDYEVLPPAEVWEGVHSAVKVRTRPVILLRVAAAAAVLVVAGMLALRWNREIAMTSSPAIAFTVRLPDPLRYVPDNYSELAYPAEIEKAQPLVADYLPVENAGQATDLTSQEFLQVQSIGFKTQDNLTLVRKNSPGNSLLASDASVHAYKPNLNYMPVQYFPDNTPVKNQEKWSVAAMASPTYFSQISSGSGAAASQVSSSEEPMFSYSGGLALSYKVSKRLTIQSGLFYSSLGQKIDGINSFSGFSQYNTSKGSPSFEVLTANGAVVTSNPDVFLSSSDGSRVITPYTNDVFDPKKASLQQVNTSLNQNFSYLEFPVVLRYKIVDKTIGINLIGGLSYNLLVNNSVTTTFNGSTYSVGDTKGVNPLSLSSSLGMGMEYSISSKLSLNLEPTFRYYLNPFSVSSGSFVHPYSFGVFSGVSYKF